MDSVKIIEQDIIHQYLDGKDLLSQILLQRRQLLQKLEQIAQTSQGSTCIENVSGFPLVRAQTLLFELSVLSDQIDALIAEINTYAERSGRPRVNVIDSVEQ